MVNNKKIVREPIITLQEKADLQIINRLLASDEISDEEKQILFNYKKKVTNGYVNVNYFYAKDMEKGRLFAEKGLSLQCIHKKIRNTLAEKNYLDIDMINGGPTILNQYCKKNNIQCNMLDRYIKYRENWLKELMDLHNISREEAKKIILKIMYLGNYTIKNLEGDDVTPNEKLEKLVEFSNELKEISKKVCIIENDLKKIVKKTSDKQNIKSSVLSLVIQNIENKCLNSAVKFFKLKNFKIGVLTFDGLMIEKKKNLKDNDINELIDECNKYVMKNTSFNIKFSVKPMNEVIDLPAESAIVNDDKDVQEKLFRLENPDYFKFCYGMLYIFNENTGKFDKCSKDYDTPLNYYLTKHSKYFYVETSTNPEFSKLKSYGKDTTLMRKVMPFVLIAARDDDWINRTASSSLGYLLFKNGIYNMKTNKFTPGFNPNIVFHCNIPYDFPEKNKDNIEYANNLSFRAMCGSDIKSLPLKVAFSRALAGDIEAKHFLICPGKTNAGKSKLVTMFRTCFGDFIQTFNAENLAYNDKGQSQDEAQKNRWAYLIRFARIIFSNEVNMKKTLNGNDIKKIASGGDEMIGRTHYQEEVHFVPHFTAFCMLNDVPEIQPLDNAVIGRLVYYEFEKQFVVTPTEDYHVQADLGLEKKIKENKFINGFINLILEAYQFYLLFGQPPFDERTKEDWTAEGLKDKNLANIISQSYMITGNDDDFVKVSEFTEFKNRNKKEFLTISAKRFSEILKVMGARDGKINNGSVRVWRGIKKIINDDIN